MMGHNICLKGMISIIIPKLSFLPRLICSTVYVLQCVMICLRLMATLLGEATLSFLARLDEVQEELFYYP